MLNLPGGTPTLNDGSGNPILELTSTGAGNYVKISNDTSGTNPAVGPVIGIVPAAGASAFAIPLQLSDQNTGGILLNSNGGLALKVVNTNAPANYVAVNGSPSGTYGGQPGARIGAANPAMTGNVALVLQAQNSGTVYVNSPLDTTAEPVVIDLPVDTTGVTANYLVTLTSAGNAKVSSGLAAGSVFGVSLASATTGTVEVAYNGRVLCTFDGPFTPGHFVIPSTSTAGQCHDNGASYSVTVQTIGLVLDTSGNILIRH